MTCTPETPCPAHAPQDLTQESIFAVKPGPAAPPPVSGPWFSPHGGCTDAIVAEIAKAKREIRVQAYGFTSDPIYQALVAAHRRGVDVRIIGDHKASLEKASLIGASAHAGIPTWTDGAHPIAHAKLIIIDGDRVFIGSFNWTHAAESNSEAMVLLHGQAIVAPFLANWEKHLAHSVPVKPGASSAAVEGVVLAFTQEERDELAA